jgi:pimeloyl-ACP methyl ester carboxylesterase
MNSSVILLVLPGLDGTDVFFRPFLAALPATIHPVVIDYPSEGSNQYADLLKIVRQAVAEMPSFYVLASSFSGPLAIMLARAEREKVRGVILSATFLRSPQPRLVRFRFAAVSPVVGMIRTLRRVPIWTLRSRADPLRRAKAETWSRVSSHVLAARVRAILDVDVRQVLRSCPQPLLCVAYADDRLVSRENADEIFQYHEAAQLVILPGRHLAMHSDPDRLATEVVRFIRSVECRAKKLRSAEGHWATPL